MYKLGIFLYFTSDTIPYFMGLYHTCYLFTVSGLADSYFRASVLALGMQIPSRVLSQNLCVKVLHSDFASSPTDSTLTPIVSYRASAPVCVFPLSSLISPPSLGPCS